MDNIKERTTSGLLWRFLERCGAQGVNLIVQIVLARLLAPELYGTIAIVTVFTAILQIFVDSGMGNALIQKKNADDIDFSSVFYFNMGMCVVLYGVMFVAAPFISELYKNPDLTLILRVMNLVLVISGVKNVQQAYVSRTMQFKRFFFATLGGTITAAIVGIWMAYAGYGVWALVAQNLVNKTIDTVVLWFTVKWRPKWVFSFSRLKGLIAYGWKLLASGLIDSVYNNVRQLIIGKMYNSADLGLYNKGQQLTFTIINNINTSIDSVLFPAMSLEQENKERVKAITRRSVKTSSYIMWPLMIGMAAVSEPFVELFLTHKWIGVVPYIRIFCITYAFYPIHTANLNAIKAMGRSDLFLKLEIAKKTLGIVVLLLTMWISPLAMAYGLLATSLIGQVVNSWPNRKLLKYGYKEQLKDIVPYICMAVVMGGVTHSITLFQINYFVMLFAQLFVGFVSYILLSKVFKIDSYEYIKKILMKMIKKGK